MIEFCTNERNISPPSCDAVLEVRIELIGGMGMSVDGKRLFATPFMISEQEVDTHINQIIAGLERVRAEAKARLSENGFSNWVSHGKA